MEKYHPGSLYRTRVRPLRKPCLTRGTAALIMFAPARRVPDPLEIAQEADRHSAGAADLDHLSEPAAKCAGTTRTVAKLAPAEQHRRGNG